MSAPGLQLYGGRPDRLLLVVAHPDDADFALAGSVARWIAAGTVARLVCCTSGDAGGGDPAADPLAVAARREREQRDAAAIVGYEDVTFLHRPEGALANDLALREQLVRLMRGFRPDVVATGDPRVMVHAWGQINAVDHREAGAAALDAVYPAAGQAMAFPHLVRSEGLEPHKARQLILFWSERATHAVDIGDSLELKLRALRAHTGSTADPGRQDEQVREWARRDGERAGVAAAETFALIDLA